MSAHNAIPLPEASVLSEYFTYDPVSGRLFWKERPRHHFVKDGAWRRFNTKLAGKEAGHKHRQKNGEPHAIVVRVSFYKKDGWYLAHRLIYSIMGVKIPEGMEIDHKDCNPWNNAWDNLRIATPSQNCANKRTKSDRPSGNNHLPKGVSIQKGRYKAQIHANGKKRHIGMYATPEDAANAYALEAAKEHGQFARTHFN